MIKILISTSTFPPRLGGIEGFVYELARFIMANGDVEVHICTPARRNSKLIENMNGIKVHRYTYDPLGLCRLSETAVVTALRNNVLNAIYIPSYVIMGLLETYKIVKKFDIDVINSHWFLPQGFNSALVRKLIQPCTLGHIASIHAADVLMAHNLPRKLGSNLASFVFSNSDYILPVSDYIKNQYLALLDRPGINSNKIRVIPMGTDTEVFKPKPKEGVYARKKYCFSQEDFLIGYLGRLDEKKGVRYLVDAMNILDRQGFKFKGFIGGSGSSKRNLEKLAYNKYQLEDKIKFLGFVPGQDMSKLYNAANVVVIPSIMTEWGDVEGMPVVLMEALACGRPVVVSDVSSIASVVRNHIEGLVVPSKDPVSIASAIRRINDDAESAYIMGCNARKRALEMFSWRVVGVQYSDLIQKLVEYRS